MDDGIKHIRVGPEDAQHRDDENETVKESEHHPVGAFGGESKRIMSPDGPDDVKQKSKARADDLLTNHKTDDSLEFAGST